MMHLLILFAWIWLVSVHPFGILAHAENDPPDSSSCSSSLLPSERAIQKDRDRVVALFREKTLHLSPERFLTLQNREGKLYQVKVIGYVETEGVSFAKVMLEDGYATIVNLEKVRSIQISDQSRNFWQKKSKEFFTQLKNKTLLWNNSEFSL